MTALAPLASVTLTAGALTDLGPPHQTIFNVGGAVGVMLKTEMCPWARIGHAFPKPLKATKVPFAVVYVAGAVMIVSPATCAPISGLPIPPRLVRSRT